jgi:hypothetical protein
MEYLAATTDRVRNDTQMAYMELVRCSVVGASSVIPPGVQLGVGQTPSMI